LWQSGRRPVLVGIAEDEFARFNVPARTGSRFDASALDRKLSKAIAIAEMIVCRIEGRNGLQIERRENFNGWQLRQECLVFLGAPLAS
jgi:hypothetical protein